MPTLDGTLHMLNRLLLQQRRLLALIPYHAPPQRRLHKPIEQKGAIDQHRKAEHLQPLERFPPQEQRHDPDEECPTGVDNGSCCRADIARDGEAEKVKAAVRGVSEEKKNGKGGTNPILIMINKLVMPISL